MKLIGGIPVIRNRNGGIKTLNRGGDSGWAESINNQPAPLRYVCGKCLSGTCGVFSGCSDCRTVSPGKSGIRVLNSSAGSLEQLFDEGFASGADSVCIIGTSAPHLPASYILEAFGRLTQHRNSLVIGPTKTNNFYLFGASGTPPYSLLKDISWDTTNVLAESLQRAVENELSVTLLPSLDVVKTQEQLKRLSRDLRREVVIAPQTQYILRKIGLE